MSEQQDKLHRFNEALDQLKAIADFDHSDVVPTFKEAIHPIHAGFREESFGHPKYSSHWGHALNYMCTVLKLYERRTDVSRDNVAELFLHPNDHHIKSVLISADCIKKEHPEGSKEYEAAAQVETIYRTLLETAPAAQKKTAIEADDGADVYLTGHNDHGIIIREYGGDHKRTPLCNVNSEHGNIVMEMGIEDVSQIFENNSLLTYCGEPVNVDFRIIDRDGKTYEYSVIENGEMPANSAREQTMDLLVKHSVHLHCNNESFEPEFRKFLPQLVKECPPLVIGHEDHYVGNAASTGRV